MMEWAEWTDEEGALTLADGRKVYVVPGDGLLFDEIDDKVLILDHWPGTRH